MFAREGVDTARSRGVAGRLAVRLDAATAAPNTFDAKPNRVKFEIFIFIDII